jgi:hypothetical protein
MIDGSEKGIEQEGSPRGHRQQSGSVCGNARFETPFCKIGPFYNNLKIAQHDKHYLTIIFSRKFGLGKMNLINQMSSLEEIPEIPELLDFCKEKSKLEGLGVFLYQAYSLTSQALRRVTWQFLPFSCVAQGSASRGSVTSAIGAAPRLSAHENRFPSRNTT